MKLGTRLPAALRVGLMLAGVLLVDVLLSTAPASAQAAPGVVRATVTLRAGPDVGFPAVNRIPRGAEVVIHGCLGDGRWCDVSFGAERGWITAAVLDYFDGVRYVYLPDSIAAAEVPVVTFAVASYWSSYYFGRPWFYRHAYWNRHWRAQVAAQAAAPTQSPRQPAQGAVAAPMAPGMMPARGAVAGPQPAMAMVPRGGTVGVAATPRGAPAMMGRADGPHAAMQGGGMHAQMGGMARASVAAMPHAAPAGGRGSGGGGGGRGGSDRRH